jgi:hypothetical protein
MTSPSAGAAARSPGTEGANPMRTYGPGHPLVFSHIPKTAGTSLRVALEQSLQPEVFVQGVDSSLLAGYDDIDALHPAARATFFVEPDELPADATLVAGHIGPGTTMARYPGADHITVLRVPQVRVLSQWLHGRSLSEFDIRHWGPAAEAFRVAWLPLRQYLEHRMLAPNIDNTMTRFLAWPHPELSRTEFIDESQDAELLAAAIARLDAFAHVNVAENPHFMQDLGAWLGRDLQQARANERTTVPRRRRPDLTAELTGDTRSLLDHRSRIDAQVWAHVVARVLPDEDPAALLESALQQSLQRYGQMLIQPAGPLTLRRVVEMAYGMAVAVDPRRRRRAA